MTKDEKYFNLCIKEITGNTNEAEKKELYKWLRRSDKNMEDYESIKYNWEKTEPDVTNDSINIEDGWGNVLNRLKENREPVAYDINESFFRRIFYPAYKPAAVFILFCIVIVSGILIYNSFTPVSKLNIISTNYGEQIDVVLPDNSTVILNSESRLEYFDKFTGEERKVTLYGEAFFSVTKNQKPFVITTGNAEVKVLGTRFDIWSRENETRVFVINGKVNFVSSSMNDNGVTLTKDQLSRVVENRKPTKPERVNSGYLIGWTKGRLVFNSSSLNEVADELERRFGIKIKIENKKLNELKLTGSFESKNIEKILGKICLAADLKYRSENETYILSRRNKSESELN